MFFLILILAGFPACILYGALRASWALLRSSWKRSARKKAGTYGYDSASACPMPNAWHSKHAPAPISDEKN